MIALDLCQPHYQDLLIIYLKFTAKIVEIKISYTYEFCNGDINKFVFLLRKSVYLYKYTNSWKRSDETMLPNKKTFYRELNLEDITDEDYTHAQKVFENLNLKIQATTTIYMFKVTHYCFQMYLKTLEVH